MGASSSTIKDTIRTTFGRADVGKKGYLTLKEVLRLPHIWGIDPGHLGVLYAVDRNHDGLVTQEEALNFAQHAAGLSRGLKARDTLTAGALTQGHCSLAMWRALQQPGGRAAFVRWIVRLITHGGEAGPAPGWDVLCVGPAAVKNLYQLFDMERRQGLLLEEFSTLLLAAAAEHGLACSLQEPSEHSSDQDAHSGGGGGSSSEAEGGDESDSDGGASSGASSERGAATGDEGGKAAGAGAFATHSAQAPASDRQQHTGRPRQLPRLPEPVPDAGAASARGPLGTGPGAAAVPLEVVEDFLNSAFDGMGGVVDSIVDASELREALEGGGGGGAPAAAGGAAGGGQGLLAPRSLVLG